MNTVHLGTFLVLLETDARIVLLEQLISKNRSCIEDDTASFFYSMLKFQTERVIAVYVDKKALRSSKKSKGKIK